MKNELPGCARCPIEPPERLCQKEDGKSPQYCPTLKKEEAISKSRLELKKPDILEFARQASIQEGEGYGDKDLGYSKVKPIKPRIIETIEFANKMDFRRLGFVFCIGLRKEARVVEKLLADEGFEVVSAVCKLGRTPKESIGIRDDQKSG